MKKIISLLPTISTNDQLYYLCLSDNKVTLITKMKDNQDYIDLKEIPENDTIFNYFK